MADISRVKLPSGNIYDIKDATAREAIAALQGGSYFLGVTTTELADNATTNPVTIEGEPVTAVNGNVVIYGNKELIFNGSKWIEFGDTSMLGDLATLDTINTTTAKVLGTNTTFVNSSSAVTFSGSSNDAVLGADTTFAVTQPTITVNPTVKYIAGTASGTAVGPDGTANAITGFGNHTVNNALGVNATFTTQVTPATTNVSATASGTALSTNDATVVTGYNSPTSDTFVKSVTAETGKNLVVTEITGCSGTASVSEVTETHSKLVTTTVPNVTDPGTADTWNFAMGTGDNAETLIISGTNGTAATLGTAKTVATGSVSDNGGGSDIVTLVDITPKTVATANANPTTVATGQTAANGTGSAVVTGVTVGTSASAITGLGTASTTSALTSVAVSAQPTITLSKGSTAVSGSIQLTDGISSTSTTVNSDNAVAAITALGTPTTAAALTGVKVTTQPTIALTATDDSGTGKAGVVTAATATATGAAVSANTNDQVSAVTNIGTGTAAAQTLTVTKSEIDAVTSVTAVVNS